MFNRYKFDQAVIELWHFLENNPYADYPEMHKYIEETMGQPFKINSLIVNLTRNGFIEVERIRDDNSQKILKSKKTCLKRPK